MVQRPSLLLPPRRQASPSEYLKVVDIIASHPNHDIIIGIDTVGKDLLLHISSMLKLKIWVWPECLQTMHLLTRIRAVPRYSFSIDTLEGLNCIQPTIGIMPSGLPWALKPDERNESPFVSTPISSHDGIECLVKGINPRSCHNSNAGSIQKVICFPIRTYSRFPGLVLCSNFLIPMVHLPYREGQPHSTPQEWNKNQHF